MHNIQAMTKETEFEVICLCAEWCGTCRDYRTEFAALATSFGNSLFRWLDIEDEADELGDLDVENFPTLLIRSGSYVLFYGTMLPHIGHLKRMLETFADLSADELAGYAQANPERSAWQKNGDLLAIRALPGHA